MENKKISKTENMKLKSSNNEYMDSEQNEPTESHLNIQLNNMIKEHSFNLSEKYDIHEMAKLLNSDVIDMEWKSRIKKYRKASHYGSVKVNYTRNKIGRLTSSNNDAGRHGKSINF